MRERAIVVTPAFTFGPMSVYFPGVRGLPPEGAAVTEVAVLSMTLLNTFSLGKPVPPRPSGPPRAPSGFTLVERRYDEGFSLLRLRSRRPVSVSADELAALRLGRVPAEVVLQRSR